MARKRISIKGTCLLLIFMFLFMGVHAQDARIQQLETIGRVWGESYLLHPSVVSQKRQVNWEHALIQYLKSYEYIPDQRSFAENVNKQLLSHLNDPLTRVQQKIKPNQVDTVQFEFLKRTYYDHIRLPASYLSKQKNWLKFDSILTNRREEKPLIIDVRLHGPVRSVPGSESCFGYICGFLTEDNLSLGSNASRYHYGWDEMNDLWPYEQKWTVTDQGMLNSIMNVQREERHKYEDFDFFNATLLNRPVYFLINNTALAYFGRYFKTLRESREDIRVIWEKTGSFYEDSDLVHFDLAYDFFLNPSIMLPAGFRADYVSNSTIDEDQLAGIVRTKVIEPASKAFSFHILPRVFPTASDTLNHAYKMLGLFKTWNVLKYFHFMSDSVAAEWQEILPEFILKAENTHTDEGYYRVLQELTVILKDSQLAFYHPSIIDYTKVYVVPIQFECLNNKLIVTEVSESLTTGHPPEPGDEIIKIQDKYIEQIIKDNKGRVSAGTEEAFHNRIFDSGRFAGRRESKIKFTFRRENQIWTLHLPRSVNYFDVGNYTLNLPGRRTYGNLGYLNPFMFNNQEDLTKALCSLEKTEGLIIDLRNSEVSGGSEHLASLLTDSTYTGLLNQVPVMDASVPKESIMQSSRLLVKPDTSCQYNNPVAVLIDQNCSKQAEKLALLLKGNNRVFFAGEHTPGVAGKETTVNLPGGGELTFTGQVVSFPDGKRFSNEGIEPDIRVERTPEAIRAGRDEILQRALEALTRIIQE